MPKLKQINKTEEVWKYLKRYGSIDRSLAISHFREYNLSDVVMRLKPRALKDGKTIKLIKGSTPAKYRMLEL